MISGGAFLETPAISSFALLGWFNTLRSALKGETPTTILPSFIYVVHWQRKPPELRSLPANSCMLMLGAFMDMPISPWSYLLARVPHLRLTRTRTCCRRPKQRTSQGRYTCCRWLVIRNPPCWFKKKHTSTKRYGIPSDWIYTPERSLT